MGYTTTGGERKYWSIDPRNGEVTPMIHGSEDSIIAVFSGINLAPFVDAAGLIGCALVRFVGLYHTARSPLIIASLYSQRGW